MIDKIHEEIVKIEYLLNQKDEKGFAWNLRVTAAYAMFRALNEPRFKLEPVDLKNVLDKLIKIKEHVDCSPIYEFDKSAETFDSSNNPEETSKRQQYLYGLAWAQLSHEEYYDSADLLRRRLVGSNIDISFIKDSYCLDMATGIARWAVAMVQLGAKKVVGMDYSHECLEGARERLENSKESHQIDIEYGDIYDLPSKMKEAFDFVVANGVIHHLPDPKGGLKSMHDCTKKGGKAFTFVFTKNDTPWWACIEVMRRVLAPVPIHYSYEILRSFEAPGSQAFNTLDYSYTPIQFKLEKDWFEQTLSDVGFSNIKYLEGGDIHDSVLRSKLYDTDEKLYGISEMRYLVSK